MVITNNNRWAKWLKDHSTNTVYDANPDGVMKLCGSSNAIQNFDDVSKYKNIVLITKAPLGAKLQLSFYHSVVGIGILPDKLHYVARIGYRTGVGVEMDPKSTFRMTGAVHIPKTVDMMRILTDAEFKSLAGDTVKQKRKLRTYAVLTPAIARVIEESDKTPGGALLAVVSFIKATMPVPAAVSGTPGTQPPTVTETEEEILKRIGNLFEPILCFLWAAHHHADVVTAPVTAPLQDEDTLT